MNLRRMWTFRIALQKSYFSEWLVCFLYSYTTKPLPHLAYTTLKNNKLGKNLRCTRWNIRHPSSEYVCKDCTQGALPVHISTPWQFCKIICNVFAIFLTWTIISKVSKIIRFASVARLPSISASCSISALDLVKVKWMKKIIKQK